MNDIQIIESQKKIIDAIADYSRNVDERMNWSCTNSTFDIFFTFDVDLLEGDLPLQQGGHIIKK